MTGYTYDILVGSKTTAGSLAQWVSRPDLPSEFILIEAQALIYVKLRIREMLVSETITVAAAASSKALNAAFLDPLDFTPYGWGSPLEYLSEANFIQPRDNDGALTLGTPSSWTIFGTDMVFDTKLDADLIGIFRSYQIPASLSVGNPTNFLTVRYPTMLRHMCEAFAYEFMKDAATSIAKRQLAEAEIAEINATNELYRRGQF